MTAFPTAATAAASPCCYNIHYGDDYDHGDCCRYLFCTCRTQHHYCHQLHVHLSLSAKQKKDRSRLAVLDKYAHVLNEYNDNELQGVILVATHARAGASKGTVRAELLRGSTEDPVMDWVTLGYPKLAQGSGKYYFEVNLIAGAEAPQVGLLSEATGEDLWLPALSPPRHLLRPAAMQANSHVLETSSDVEEQRSELLGNMRLPGASMPGRLAFGLGFLGFALLGLGFLAGRTTMPPQPSSEAFESAVIQRFDQSHTDAVVKDIFNQFDANGDGVLDMSETKGLLKQVLKETGETRSDDEIHEAAQELDHDSSGGVQKTELKQLVNHLMSGFKR
ncbi:unnamed protein product [Symbiodinium microadriaticum]|nr:unnamed protein product [Symbiodinium microadriaticum]